MEAEDLRQILALIADYCETLDDGRTEEHLDLYVDDCCLHVFGKDFEGKERIGRFMGKAHRGKHLSGVPRMTFDADSAHAVSDFVFFREDMKLYSAGTYHDDFLKTPSGWRIQTRKIEIQLRGSD
ncbi:MAG: nuclear transport factor 2 family protein [bacterium]|nr:hypothetical protein [Deltaproteobacteria bacterium]MCP4906207.1 nuclear transport factor 2 family protein [bacterium]